MATDETAAAGDDDVHWSNRHVANPLPIVLPPGLWPDSFIRAIGSVVRRHIVNVNVVLPGPRSPRVYSRLTPVRDEQGRTVLITGVTGQDGIYLARFLRGRGARVVGAAPTAASPPALCAAYLGDVEVVAARHLRRASRSSG